MHLRLLGAPVLYTETDEVPLPPERRFQLLAYLAYRDAWVSREQVMALLWPAHSSEDARRNLRRLLHDIRRLPWLTTFESQGDALRWQVATDVGELARACARQDWQAALESVSGALLEGMEANATEPFHEWLRYERELQMSRWRSAVENRRGEISADPVARVELALQALRFDAHSESAMQDLLDALRATGRDDEARRAYQEFAQRLREELGVEPTVRLRSVLSGESPPPGRQPVRVSTATGDGLIGRRLEKVVLAELLSKDECRCVTLHGPGGVGKSSLARSSLPTLAEAFPDGAHWIELQDLASVAQVPPRIAEACGFKLAMSQDALASVADRIGEARVLLVFDNCEHLPDIGSLDNVLFERCPGLKILHTSRSRVGSSGEWVMPLAGLPVPDAEETDIEVLRTFDSVRLFEVRAHEIEPRFDMERDCRDVVALVRMVEGLPLALELAAACIRLLPVSDILKDLSQLMNLPHPAQAAGGPAARDRSLRACFDHSWRLLTPNEQSQLAQLAVFGGSFSLAAAHYVTGAELVSVGSLVDKSLVSSMGGGRFSLHPLLRQLAREHLREERGVRNRHAAYFAQAMLARVAWGASLPEAWSDEDLSNCVDAWRWADSQNSVALLQAMGLPLIKLFSLYLRWQEGIETFTATLKGLEGSDGRTELLRATLLYGEARCRLYHGELDAAEETARRSLRICRSLHYREVASGVLHTIGYSLAWRGETVKARRYLEESLKRAVVEGDAESLAQARYSVAFLEQVGGNWDAARRLHRENEALCQHEKIYWWLALTYNGLGGISLAQGDLAESLDHFDEGIAVCAAHEINLTRAFLTAHRGLALIRRGELELAERSIAVALTEARQWNVKTASVEAHLARCCLALAQQDAALALQHLQQAMDFARQIRSPLRTMSVVRYWGEWLLAFGDEARGMAVLEFVRINPKTQEKDRLLAYAAMRSRSPTPAHQAGARKAALTMTLPGLEVEALEASGTRAPRAAPAPARTRRPVPTPR